MGRDWIFSDGGASHYRCGSCRKEGLAKSSVLADIFYYLLRCRRRNYFYLDTTTIGRITEARVLTDLAASGHFVLLPFGDGCRYDLAVDLGGRILRIQCKTGVLRGGAVVFRTYGVGRNGEKSHYVEGEIDFFAVFCPETEQVYYIPAEEAGDTSVSLRVTLPRNGQKRGVHMADDYLELHL